MGFFSKWRTEKKVVVDQDVIDKLEMLARVEKRIAQFYDLCAETRRNDGDFWREIAESARRHLQDIHHIREIYSEHPQQFGSGYPFNIAAIRLFELSLRELPGRSRLGEIDRKELLAVVEKIENSTAEMNCVKMLKSDNEEFNRLAARLDAESEEHRRTISALLEGKQETLADRMAR